MRKIYAIFLAVLLTASLFAQSPQKMSYQAVIRNSSDELVPNHAVGMRVSILQGSATGTVVYTETQTPTTNANGLVSIEIGGGAGFDAINWANHTFFIKTETDPTGGTSYTITGTSQLLSVPYALHAKTAASYNETDPVFISHPSHGISGANITNWNSAYGWGNHSGLYRPIGYVPAWSEITSNPFSFVSPSNNQLLKYNTTSSKFENWTPNYLTSFTETDPIFIAWNKSTGISITASQVSDFQTTVTNNAAMLLNTAKVTNATHTGDATGATALTVVRINGTSLAGLATGILKNTTSTGVPSIAVAGTDYLTPTGSAALLTNFPIFNQNTTGNAATVTTNANLTGDVTSTGNTTIIANKQTMTATAPLSLTGSPTVIATGTVAISIAAATPSTAGSMSAADKTKLDGISTPTHSIGESYGGGIIFYLDASGKHGLIAATTDQSTGIQWYNGSYTNTTAFASAVGAGDGNTSMIVFNQGTGTYAARLCFDLNTGGFTDWYLPSKYELDLMYKNIGQGNLLGLGNVGGFANIFYWSSAEASSNYAWRQYFGNGYQSSFSKLSAYYVRAVRAF